MDLKNVSSCSRNIPEIFLLQHPSSSITSVYDISSLFFFYIFFYFPSLYLFIQQQQQQKQNTNNNFKTTIIMSRKICCHLCDMRLRFKYNISDSEHQTPSLYGGHLLWMRGPTLGLFYVHFTIIHHHIVYSPFQKYI